MPLTTAPPNVPENTIPPGPSVAHPMWKSFEIGRLANCQKRLSFGFCKQCASWAGRPSVGGVRSAPRAAGASAPRADTSMGITEEPGGLKSAPFAPAPSTRAWAFSRQGSSPASMRAWTLRALAEARAHASMGIAAHRWGLVGREHGHCAARHPAPVAPSGHEHGHCSVLRPSIGAPLEPAPRR